MTTPFTYDFGYSWSIAWGLLIPVVLFGSLAVLGSWRRWRGWIVIVCGLVAVWGVAGLVITHAMFRINLPLDIPTDRFLSTGAGRVIDVGAGSGRASVALLRMKPRVTITAVDIYKGYFGIDDNTPGRLMGNARIAGVADRVEAIVGDARELPLETGTYDGVISAAAIDHLPRAGIPVALREVARVLKPGGELLLIIVNADAWAWIASPLGIAHHPRTDRNRWRGLLESSGFEVVEQGTQPAAAYFYCRKARSM